MMAASDAGIFFLLPFVIHRMRDQQRQTNTYLVHQLNSNTFSNAECRIAVEDHNVSVEFQKCEFCFASIHLSVWVQIV